MNNEGKPICAVCHQPLTEIEMLSILPTDDLEMVKCDVCEWSHKDDCESVPVYIEPNSCVVHMEEPS